MVMGEGGGVWFLRRGSVRGGGWVRWGGGVGGGVEFASSNILWAGTPSCWIHCCCCVVCPIRVSRPAGGFISAFHCPC